MRTDGVMGHELLGDLFRERGIEAAADVDCRWFLMLTLVVCSNFRALTPEVSLFGVWTCFGKVESSL